MRLFAAIPLSLAVQERLESLQAGLPEGRAMPPENLHLTLAFFDRCDRHVAAELDAGLAAIRGEAMELWFDGLGMFGGPRPRVLYAALRPDPRLSRLRNKVVRVAQGAGIDLRRERFSPHVTIARFSNGAGRGPRMQRWLEGRAGFAYGPVATAAFSLFRSELGASGATYTELARYPLNGAGAD